DLVYWGWGTGANAPSRKTSALCQDGPDAGGSSTCYAADAGNPAGSMGKALAAPASGAGTRQRIGPEGAEAPNGNGCAASSGNPVDTDLWIFYDTQGSTFTVGADPKHLLVGAPGTALQVITVGAWATKSSWMDCAGNSVQYSIPPTLGDIASFSSPGPTRDGREKPDLAAPGFGVASALSHDLVIACPSTPDRYLNDGMQHWVIEGTSMAAPHVTG